MARVNVYLPDDLAAEVKEARLNVSAIAQRALREALGNPTTRWLATLPLAGTGPSDEAVADALAATDRDFGG